MNTMRKEYELQTDVLATIVAATPVTQNHADLLTILATRTDYCGARYVKTRDEFSEQPARIVDGEDREIAADYRTWIDAQLDAHGGSVHAVWRAPRRRGTSSASGRRLCSTPICDARRIRYVLVVRNGFGR